MDSYQPNPPKFFPLGFNRIQHQPLLLKLQTQIEVSAQMNKTSPRIEAPIRLVRVRMQNPASAFNFFSLTYYAFQDNPTTCDWAKRIWSRWFNLALNKLDVIL
jgi:hypothetical protein